MSSADVSARRRWMGVLAKATPDEIAESWARLPPIPAYRRLRGPDVGLVMVRGRTGGDGAPFNLGEMTVTRCSVRIDDGTVGHAWIAGRMLAQAERAAVLDALLQRPEAGPALAHEVDRLEALQSQRRDAAGRKAAATKVDFFTLVRGEN